MFLFRSSLSVTFPVVENQCNHKYSQFQMVLCTYFSLSQSDATGRTQLIQIPPNFSNFSLEITFFPQDYQNSKFCRNFIYNVHGKLIKTSMTGPMTYCQLSSPHKFGSSYQLMLTEMKISAPAIMKNHRNGCQMAMLDSANCKTPTSSSQAIS